jgi:hypothetical protein
LDAADAAINEAERRWKRKRGLSQMLRSWLGGEEEKMERVASR